MANWQRICDEYNGTKCQSKAGMFACVCGENYRSVGRYVNESHIDQCELIGQLPDYEAPFILFIIIAVFVGTILLSQLLFLIVWGKSKIEKNRNSLMAITFSVGDSFSFKTITNDIYRRDSDNLSIADEFGDSNPSLGDQFEDGLFDPLKGVLDSGEGSNGPVVKAENQLYFSTPFQTLIISNDETKIPDAFQNRNGFISPFQF